MYVKSQFRSEGKNFMSPKNVKESSESRVIRKVQMKNKSEIKFHVHRIGTNLSLKIPRIDKDMRLCQKSYI